jgi:hypothetical protein
MHEILQHVWNLLWKSIVDFPALLSGNWLGAIILPLGLYVLFEVPALRRGWSAMTPEKKQAFWRNSGILIGVYLLLFSWVVVRTIYHDHMYLVSKIREQKEQIKPAPDPELKFDMTADGHIGNHYKAIVAVSIINRFGPARALTEWKLDVSGNGQTWEGRPILAPLNLLHMMGTKGSPEVILRSADFCPKASVGLIPAGGMLQCWLWSAYDPSYEQVRKSGNGNPTVILSFRDVLTGKRLVFRQEIKNGIPTIYSEERWKH